MIGIFKESMLGQYEASLATLANCAENCPDEWWLEPVVELKFSQVVFHTLFFTDVYLGKDLASLKDQAFHQEHSAIFDGYEELEPVRQKSIYDRSFIRSYFTHCRIKAAKVIAGESEDSLAHKPGFDWLSFSRAEVHVYNVRHIQHHAAQLSLHLRLKIDESIDWQKSGWGDSLH